MTSNKIAQLTALLWGLKDKEIYSHIGSGKSFQQVLTGSNISKGSKGMKNIKFSGKAGSADQEAMVEFFLKNLLNVIQEKGYMEE